MRAVSFRHYGNFKNNEKFLKRCFMLSIEEFIAPYGKRGVEALKSATPVDTGDTVGAWHYEIHKNKTSFSLQFKNRNVNQGMSIAILIQYGHGTRNGGFVQGRDFINPALQPIFNEIAEKLWKEVRGL